MNGIDLIVAAGRQVLGSPTSQQSAAISSGVEAAIGPWSVAGPELACSNPAASQAIPELRHPSAGTGATPLPGRPPLRRYN